MTESTPLRRKIWFGYSAFLVLWAILMYAQLFIFLSEGTLFARLVENRPYVSDFVNHYNAGKLSREYIAGNHLNVYDVQVQDASVRKLIAPIVPEVPFYLQYPPWFFAWMLPLSMVSMPVAWGIWFTAGMVALTAGLVVSSKLVGRSAREPFTVICAIGAIAAFPAWLSCQLGQTALIVFPSMVLIWLLLFKNKPLPAGLSTALIMIKVQYMPMIGLVGAIAGGARFIVGTVLALAVNLVLAVLAVGTENVLRFPSALLNHETGTSVSGVAVEAMQNFRGQTFLLTAGNASIANAVAAALFVACCSWVTALWWSNRKVLSDGPTFLHLASITTIVLLISSLHTHAQDYLLLSPALLWIWDWNSRRPLESQQRAGAKSISALIAIWPFLSWLFLIKELFYLIRVEPYLLWVLALLFCTMREWSFDRKAVSAAAAD